jgi:hypothetical protein
MIDGGEDREPRSQVRSGYGPNALALVGVHCNRRSDFPERAPAPGDRLVDKAIGNAVVRRPEDIVRIRPRKTAAGSDDVHAAARGGAPENAKLSRRSTSARPVDHAADAAANDRRQFLGSEVRADQGRAGQGVWSAVDQDRANDARGGKAFPSGGDERAEAQKADRLAPGESSWPTVVRVHRRSAASQYT